MFTWRIQCFDKGDCKMRRCCCISLICTGVAILVLGCLLGFWLLPLFVHHEVGKSVQLTPSEQYQRWMVLPIPIKFSIYIFNVLNPDEIMEGAKAKLEEQGPYVYTQTVEKANVKFNKERSTLTYDQMFSFEFDKELSGDRDPNVDSVTVLHATKYGVMENALSLALNLENLFPGDENKIFQTIKVREMIFDGYQFCGPTLNDKPNPNHNGFECSLIRLAAKSIKNMRVEKDNSIAFSLLYHKNATSDGVFEINTGGKDAAQTGEIMKFNGSPYVPFWLNEQSVCNRVSGTDSYVFAPYKDKDSILEVFSADICRTVQLKYEKEIEYKELPGKRFALGSDTFNYNLNDNHCFCIDKTKPLDGKECLPNGFVDLYNCYHSNVIASFPHFLYADDSIKANIEEGIEANEEKHYTYVDLETNTGTALRGAKRIQFNMVLRNKFLFMKKVTPSIFPIAWVEEKVELTDELIDMLNDEYFSKLPIVEGIKWALIAVGLVIPIISGIVYCCTKKSGKTGRKHEA